MLRIKSLVLASALLAGHFASAPSAEAGPLMDWIRNRCARTQCPPPAAPCMQTCQTTCMQTCQRTVVNYVPYTAYRCEWERVPVTTYRQTTTTDPCTGCTVTCNRPCTTYTWRAKQTPYTTYRPVYRTETYQVPVTYTTQSPVTQPCNTCPTPTAAVAAPAAAVAAPVAASGCNTCTSASPTYVTPPANQYYQQAPATGTTVLEQSPTLGTGTTEADLRPTLDTNPQNMNRPVLIDDDSGNTGTVWPNRIQPQPAASPVRPLQDPWPESRWEGNDAPQLVNPFNHTTEAPSIERWSYSPVRLASHQEPLAVVDHVPAARPTISNGQDIAPRQRVNEGWRTD